LVGRVGRDIATRLTRALERIDAIAASGRVEHGRLRALRDETAGARRVALRAQQIGRIAATAADRTPARHSLPQALREALAQRSREAETLGLEVRQDLQPVEVSIDGKALQTLLQTLLDWCFEHARSPIELRIESKPWPARAHLSGRFHHVPPDEWTSADAVAAERAEAALDSAAWRLLSRLALVLGMPLQRADASGLVRLSIEFALAAPSSAIAPVETDAAAPIGGWAHSQPLIGRHLLVLAGRRETRNGVRESVRPMGLMVDYVASIDEARDFCSQGLPHAIVYESALAGERFRALRREWSAQAPTLAFIEIGEDGRSLEVSDTGGERTSRIGRDVITDALPNALLLELSQQA
jgi:hypothetical protein